MEKAHLRTPHFSCNPKSYLWGEDLHRLADKAEECAVKYDLDCIFTAQLIDLPYVIENCPHLTPCAQMIDPIEPGRGIYTDMNALRPDEDLDNIHSIYVDQWDWEKVMTPQQRNLDYLKQTVRHIYEAVKVTENKLFVEFPQIEPILPDGIHFIHAQELLDRYPSLSAKERENAIAKEYGAVFIIGIGGKLSNGQAHDGRAADYDDWSLNGDILLWNPVLGSAFEISSMGIRVDAPALHRQLAERDQLWKEELYFHRLLLDGKLPQTIGGGIGQSRLCMFLLRKAHIGEIQSAIWPADMRAACHAAGIELA